MAKGLLVAAPASGAGKTVVTAGIIRALVRRGVRVRAAKAGPDYIDPAFHHAASGHDCVNLDSWAMAPAVLDATLADASRDTELVVVEGAMGLFDGLPGESDRRGAAADLAARYHLPVVIVLDATGLSQTAAALARGLATHHPDVRIAGVVLNRVASARHAAYAGEAIEAADIKVFGAIRRDEALAFSSRHLGLIQAIEHGDLHQRIERLAGIVEAALDLDAILAAAVPLRPSIGEPVVPLPPPGNRIALATDEAFTFVYPHVISGWRRAGATIATFSPLADEAPSDDCDCCWLPGGYPELHAGRLAAAERFLSGLRRFAATRLVHGECGGHMVLGEWLQDGDGQRHRMAGLLGHATSFSKRRLTLGYREATLLADGPVGKARAIVRGHEFHYATVAETGSDMPLAEIRDGQGRSLGPAGNRRGLVSGTFFHAIATER
jgi:cobyrinic acid a,c-diamide synthase